MKKPPPPAPAEESRERGGKMPLLPEVSIIITFIYLLIILSCGRIL
jgi:hypothetical protein